MLPVLNSVVRTSPAHTHSTPHFFICKPRVITLLVLSQELLHGCQPFKALQHSSKHGLGKVDSKALECFLEFVMVLFLVILNTTMFIIHCQCPRGKRRLVSPWVFDWLRLRLLLRTVERFWFSRTLLMGSRGVTVGMVVSWEEGRLRVDFGFVMMDSQRSPIRTRLAESPAIPRRHVSCMDTDAYREFARHLEGLLRIPSTQSSSIPRSHCCRFSFE
jgi:hypothetical protein